ncbi:MMPL family transporter [Natrialba asiatica]|uniref:Patched family protein n=1 Tax=Natrialba asiatica (strain ATCC 700177 / DSM 12278 / JCM 9576 / FERM P-10747 / NBRC 102637 / 172P1) TaxID=29540 RepID=M0B184_NATA1|nr:MMPL family transporter [Natrialba asiatica]ELZ03459.1 Patched family protein [Natrialba asiatica DSM 12278]
MSAPERLAAIVTKHSRVVLVVLLLATAVVGAGATMVDDDSSLDQFETDSDEARALEDIEGNFTSEQQENTTSLQVITRTDEGGDGGENVLTKSSLISSLEFQQDVRANESINETLADDQPITGVENIIAISAIRSEEADALNETSARLERGLNETVAIQRQYEQLNATYDESDPEYETRAAELEAQLNATVENATAPLTDAQTAEYESAVQQARDIESQRYQLEQTTDDPNESSEYQELTEQLEGVYQAGTVGVLEEEYAALEGGADGENDSGDRPSLDEQIDALEELDDDEFSELVAETLSDGEGEDNPAISLMPTSYEPGSTEADARLTSITQSAGGDGMSEMGGVDDAVVDSQLEIRDMANEHEGDYLVFGSGLITDEIDRSMGDSLAIVGPLALLFVVVALLVAYRDLLDIVLGIVGIGAVLVWTFGFMGWAGIAFNQMFVAVPVLLIGLSIDYAIHVFMRHREQRETERSADADDHAGSVRGSMSVALAGVGVALVWVTATTVIGFLSNLVSPIGPIREFGIVSSVGIVAALIVFGALIPAAKVELDAFLEGRGLDRHKRAFGTGGGRFSEVLTLGSTAARKIPLIVLVLVLVLSVGGVYGATQVDTSFQEEDFLAEDPPAWTESLPGGMSPGEYQAKDDLDYVNQEFQRADSQAQLLVEGDVADPALLEQINATREEAASSDVAYELATGEADVQDPLSTMESVAAQNESFNESFTAADTDNDGVPDENVSALYDELFEVDEEAAGQVLHQTDDGEYNMTRLVIGTDGGATTSETTDEMRAIAESLEDGGDGDWTVTATGDPIVSYIVEQDLLDTVLESLLITLVAVFVFLTAAYWLTGNSATLGTVTLLPVAFSVSWILGTMYLLGMPFNVLTGMITSLTIGLGVAYSIHVSARYSLELERQGNVWSALRTTVTGTGGALLGSAATTVGGFGVLAFAILPALQQFGIITALTITYAFLASVVVLPTLLVLWTRYFGPDVSFDFDPTAEPTPASDGGAPADAATAEDTASEDGDDR